MSMMRAIHRQSGGFTLAELLVTIGIIAEGVHDGIERWCSRLMPTLLAMMVLLIAYVMTLDGAMDGLRAYLLPDFDRAMQPDLIVSALGQAFFSMSLGVGTRLLAAGLLTFVPIFFAGVIFATSFAATDEPDRAFGANVAGAMLGGALEYLSLVVGYQQLLLLAIAIYALSAVRTRKS